MTWAGLDAEATAEFLSGLIRCESPDPPGDETKVATWLAEALRGLGFDVRLDEFAPRRFNVMARVRGAGTRKGLVFSAHMDTLPIGTGEWRRDPFGGQVEAGRVHGRGACDMKSGLAAMVSAALAVQRSGVPLQGDLVLAFTGGESSRCLGAQHLAVTGALADCGAILVSEPTSLDVVTAEKAALWLRLTARGRAGHLSGGAGDSAILRLMAALAALPGLVPGGTHPLLGGATVNIGRIGGGNAINLIPDEAWAEADFRLLPGQDAAGVEAAVQALGVGVSRIDLKPAVETDAGHPFARLCLSIAAKERGTPARPKGVAYFSDAAVLSPAFGLPIVIIGPGTLGGSGVVDESVAVDDVMRAARIFGKIAEGWLSS